MSYSDPPQFGDSAKVPSFGAPKSNTTKSTKNQTPGRSSTVMKQSKTSKKTSHFDGGMSVMSSTVVFEEVTGPEIVRTETITITKDQRNSATLQATKSSKP